MSVQPSQPSDDGQPAGTEGRRFSTLVGAMPVSPAVPVSPAADQEAAPRPTFTPQPVRPVVVVTPERSDTPDSGDSREPDGAAQPVSPVVPVVPAPADGEATRVLPRPAPADLDEPLLGDVAALRARWQRVQAGFVDDPKEAVGDAADLIEQTAQTLVGALRQRQRQLRVMWERGLADDGTARGSAAADGAGEAAAGEAATARGADTEHLRLMMQRYRALFSQLCRP